jgi:hypothetical protein
MFAPPAMLESKPAPSRVGEMGELVDRVLSGGRASVFSAKG